MVDVAIEGDHAVFSVQGWDKLWSLRSRLEIPLAHIVRAVPDPTVARGWLDGLKLAGTFMPGVISAGTFYQDHGLVFWDVHDSAGALVIELEHEHYRKLIIEVDDPTGTAAAIERARTSRAS